MKNCENCDKLQNSSYGSGRFCDSKCARGFSTKNKRGEINKKISKTLTREDSLFNRKCRFCSEEYKSYKNKNVLYCSNKCRAKYNWSDEDYRKRQIAIIRERCDNDEERERLKEIGRKGGFGKKGYTKNGVYFESNFEKKCFEFLDSKSIKFIPHKPIPNSSKISDVYLNDFELWIELDGVDREKRKKWLGENYKYWLNKLEIYKREGINVKIIKTYDEFVRFIIKLGVQN